MVERPLKGRVLYYWQPTPKLIAAGFRAVRLSDHYATAIREALAENEKLDLWRTGGLSLDPAPRHAADSLQALFELFQRSDDFKRVAERTRRDFLYSMKHALAWAGDARVRDLGRGIIREWHMDVRERHGPATARNAAAALRRLLTFGWNLEWIPENPAMMLRLETPKGVDRQWTLAERDAFIGAAQAGGWHSMGLAVMLGWCLGQRPADLRRLAWSAYDGRAITLRQNKTAKLVAVPCLPELRAMLDERRAALKAENRITPAIVVSERTKKPYEESDFQHRFAAIRDAAGLPKDLKFRLLRHTLATALAAAGCSLDEIRAITGHSGHGAIHKYVRPNSAVAESAMGKLTARGPKGKEGGAG